MIDTKHENAIKVKEWFDKSGIELSCSDEVVVEIYKDISYYGKIVNSISLKERIHVMKMQISFIRKNILGLMYKENNSAKGIKGGYVYAIHNPAWEEYVKIGGAIDVYDRLASYQTSSPFRDYEVIGYVYSNDRLALEKEIHSKFERNNEWVKTDKSTIKRFLKDHEDFPEDTISRFCLMETINAIGESDVIRKESVEKLKVRLFLKHVKHVLKTVSDTYNTLDVSSSECVKRQNKVWYHSGLEMFTIVEDDSVKVIWNEV